MAMTIHILLFEFTLKSGHLFDDGNETRSAKTSLFTLATIKKSTSRKKRQRLERDSFENGLALHSGILIFCVTLLSSVAEFSAVARGR
jgi:hypothetical protein